MSENRQKGPDEMFCRSCGEVIKKEAEICPNCGVRNEGAQNKSSRNTGGSSTHDPSQYETTVSGTWWYAIAAGILGWVAIIAAASVDFNAGGPLQGLFIVIVWIGLPIAAYFDMQYIRANGKWNPNTVLWVIVFLVWFVNLIGGIVYLYRRHEVLDVP